MFDFKKMIMLCLCFVLLACMLASCGAGEQGPQGIQGVQGEKGDPGEDGVSTTVEISLDGYWVINGTKTAFKAIGEDGENGATPTVTVNADGYWVINNVVTEHRAVAQDGINGTTPKLRINTTTSIWEVSYDNEATWISLGVKATGENGNNGVTPLLRVDTATKMWQVSYDNGQNWGTLDVKAEGENGKKLEMQINEETNLWEYRYEGDTEWISTGVKATGATIEKAEFDEQGKLVITLTDGTVLDPVELPKQVVTHTATFDLGYQVYNRTYATQTVEHGEAAQKPQDPIRAGYVFKGWYVGDEQWSFVGYTVNFDVTLVAKWTPVDGYAIDYILNGGTNSSENPTEYKAGDTVTLAEPTRTGYSFTGWYTSADLRDRITSVSAETTGDLTLYAGWQAQMRYKLNETGGISVDYLGDEAHVVVPAEIDGYTVTEIDDGGFCQKMNLVSVTLPDTIKRIGWQAFWYSPYLESVNIPEGVEEIGGEAFSIAYRLKEIHIPSSVKSIGKSAFGGGASLRTLTVAEGNETYYSEGNCIIERATGKLVAGCSGSVIPNDGSVKSIGSCAFWNARGLYSVTIPASVESIEEYAFTGCCNLVEVYNYSAITLEKGSRDNGGVAEYAEHIYTTNEPSKLTTTEDGYVFYVNGEQYYLMGYVGSEVELELPASYNGMTYAIHQDAFMGSQLERISIPDGVTGIGGWAFGMTNLTALEIPDSVTYVGDGVVSYSKNLSYVVFPAGVIPGENTFNNCVSLTDIYTYDTAQEWADFLAIDDVLPEGATVHYYSALRPTDAAVSYWRYFNGVPTAWGDIPDSEGLEFTANSEGYTLSGIGDCTDSDIIVPATYLGLPVTEVGQQAFDDTSITDIVLPSSVKLIGEYAFQNCKNLTAIALPEGVEEIDFVAFGYCENVTSIVLPSTLKTIGSSAFSYTDVAFVAIPDSVESIGDWAFMGCEALESMVFGSGLTWFSSNAFYDSDALSSVYYKGTAANWEELGFADRLPSGVTVYFYLENAPTEPGVYWHFDEQGEIVFWEEFVPSEGLYFELNEAQDGYILMGMGECTDTEIVIPYTYQGLPVVEIDSSFSLSETVTSLTVSGNIKEIPGYLCDGHTGLQEVIFLEGVETVYAYAFDDCSNLTRVELPKSIAMIGSYSFDFYNEALVFYYPGAAEEWALVSKDSTMGEYCTVALLATVGGSITLENSGSMVTYYIVPETDTLTVTATAYDIYYDFIELYLGGEMIACDMWNNNGSEQQMVYELTVTAGEPLLLTFCAYENVTVTFE